MPRCAKKSLQRANAVRGTEQALAKLEISEQYKVKVIEIRSDIENVRTRIEAIIKEKNDLEENLRIARNLQDILRNAQGQEKLKLKLLII